MNNIKQIRQYKQITLTKLASITGLSCGYLCHLEKGSRNNPSYSSMKKIAIALNKSIGEIFF